MIDRFKDQFFDGEAQDTEAIKKPVRARAKKAPQEERIILPQSDNEDESMNKVSGKRTMKNDGTSEISDGQPKKRAKVTNMDVKTSRSTPGKVNSELSLEQQFLDWAVKGTLNKQLLPSLKEFISNSPDLCNTELKALKKDNLVKLID